MPVSEDSKVLQVQQTMVEAWRIIHDAFEDASFHGRDWEVNILPPYILYQSVESKNCGNGRHRI